MAGQKGRILWLDNDLGMIAVLAQGLEDAGYDVDMVGSITEAKSRLQAIQSYDLVIIDVMLPSLSEEEERFMGPLGSAQGGLAFARWLRREHPALRFAGLSVRTSEDVRRWFQEYGVGFWSKLELGDPQRLHKELTRAMRAEVSSRFSSFIVHGHDHAAKYELKNFLQNALHLPEPRILHEFASVGQTLIEKFEAVSADADVVFVLLTPDDVVLTGGQEARRARQNAIFELGYFLGHLGRNSGRVILLHRGLLELPSDLVGLVYIDIGQGIEHASEAIRRELRALGAAV